MTTTRVINFEHDLPEHFFESVQEAHEPDGNGISASGWSVGLRVR